MTEGRIRRVITGFDENGRSIITSDGYSPSVRSVAGRPGYYSTNIWRSGESPVSIHESDTIEDCEGVAPPSGGTVLRVIEFPPEPENKEEAARQIRAAFSQVFKDADRSNNQQRHPGMHQTDTVDYAVVLEGEIFAILDEDETILRAGDFMIQRGTNHAWSNRSSSPCKVAFILIDGRRD